MNGWGVFWIVVCVVFWLAFAILVRQTNRLGMKSRKLGAFWFSLVSLTALSIVTLIYVLSN